MEIELYEVENRHRDGHFVIDRFLDIEQAIRCAYSLTYDKEDWTAVYAFVVGEEGSRLDEMVSHPILKQVCDFAERNNELLRHETRTKQLREELIEKECSSAREIMQAYETRDDPKAEEVYNRFRTEILEELLPGEDDPDRDRELRKRLGLQ